MGENQRMRFEFEGSYRTGADNATAPKLGQSVLGAGVNAYDFFAFASADQIMHAMLAHLPSVIIGPAEWVEFGRF